MPDRELQYKLELDQQKLKKEIDKKIGREQEREKPMSLYFEFGNVEKREQAMAKLNELRQVRHEYDDAFRYFESCVVDPGRNDGIEIRFQRNIPELRDIFEKLLADQGMKPKEEYETVDGKPQPQETRINS